MRLVSAIALLLRRVRAERGVLALIFVVVAVTCFGVAAGPRLFERMADDGLRYEVAHARAIQRNLQFSTVDQIGARRSAPLEGVAQRGESIRSDLPGEVRAIADRDRFVVETSRFAVSDPPDLPVYITLRQQAGIDGLVTLSAGRWPQRVEPGPPSDPPAPVVVEIALGEAAAASSGLAVGDRVDVAIDQSDLIVRGHEVPFPVAFEVVGLYTVNDPTAPDWFDEARIDQALIGGTADRPVALATALFAPDAYADVVAMELPMRYRWNVFVDSERLDARRLDALEVDLRRLRTAYATGVGGLEDTVVLRTGLLDVIARYRAERTTTEAAVTLAALGPLVVAAGAVGLLGILVVRRRRAALRLTRSRGASSGQIIGAQAWEGLLVTVPAAVAGLLLAEALVAGPWSGLSGTGVIGVALAATLILVLATVPIARRARRDLERDDPPVFRLSPRRLVFEALVVGLSLTAVWLLRERGLTAVRSGEGRPGVDPFLAAAPVLVGLAVGLIVIRLYPLPVRALGWLSAARRDLVPVLGLRSISRFPTAGYLPLLILALTVAIGTLSSMVGVSLARSQVAASWRDVGADYRLEGRPGDGLAERLQAAPVPGVEAMAAGMIVRDASLVDPSGVRHTLPFEAVDPAAYDAVVAGSPVATSLTSVFLGSPAGPDAGSEGQPIPAILSTRLPGGVDDLAVGDAFRVTTQGTTLHYVVAGRSEVVPGMPLSTPFVVAPLPSVLDGWDGTAPRPTVAFVRGGPAVIDGLREAAGRGTVLESRHGHYAAMRDAPLVAAIVGGFGLALAVAAVYAALSVVTVAALDADRRARQIAYLRTLGLTDRQVTLLTVVEQGVPLVLALVIGIALGIGLGWLVEPGLDLAAFSDAKLAVGLQVDWPSLAIVAGVIVVVVVAALAASSWVARHLGVGAVLRVGDD